MNYHGYDIEEDFLAKFDGYDRVKWKPTGSGEFAFGVKDGKRYFLKRNTTVIFPDVKKFGAVIKDPEKLRKIIDEKSAPFKALRRKQNKMKELMASLDFDADHISREIENITDEENRFVTVTRAVMNGVGTKDFDYTSISSNDFLSLCLQMAEEIEKLHACGVIHSDIKIDNFVLADKTTPYLIDFDISFPADAIPDNGEIGGTDKHITPEVYVYREKKDDDSKKAIGKKIDIFALAITWHYLWTYDYPKCDGDATNVGVAHLNGLGFSVDPKFDFEIPGAELKFSELLNAMLAKDPSARPDASKIVNILKGVDKGLVEVIHVASVALKDKSLTMNVGETKTLSVTVLPADAANHSVSWKSSNDSAVTVNNGKVTAVAPGNATITVTSVDGGFTDTCSVVVAPKVSIDSAWEKDHITFIEKDKLVAMGIVSIKKGAREGSYLVTRASGLTQAYSAATLVTIGAATKAPSKEPDDKRVWAEDAEEGYGFAAETLSVKGIKTIEKTTDANGVHSYHIVYTSKEVVLTSRMCRMLGILTKVK